MTSQTNAASTEWPADRPFRVICSIATGDRLTRSTSQISLFATEAEATEFYNSPRQRHEASRSLDCMLFGTPDRYGSANTLKPIARKKFTLAKKAA